MRVCSVRSWGWGLGFAVVAVLGVGVFFLQLSVIGSTMGSRDQLGRLLRFCEQTGVRPVIDRTLPLSAARDGFAAMASGELFGKVVFTR